MQSVVRGEQAYAYTAGRSLQEERSTVVFVHGAGCDHSVWILQSRYFAYHERNTLAVDLPGHGRSAGAALGDIGAMADWVCALLDVLGIERAAVIGHSMGSLVALEAAARYSDRVSHIALLGTAVPMPVGAPLLDAAHQNRHLAYDMINLWGHSYRAQLGGNPVPGMWLTGGALRVLESSHPDVLYTDLAACNSYLDGLEKAEQVDCPALLLLGDSDLMTRPKGAQAVAERLPEARVKILPGCGHMLMGESPDAVLDALTEFI